MKWILVLLAAIPMMACSDQLSCDRVQITTDNASVYSASCTTHNYDDGTCKLDAVIAHVAKDKYLPYKGTYHLQYSGTQYMVILDGITRFINVDDAMIRC